MMEENCEFMLGEEENRFGREKERVSVTTELREKEMVFCDPFLRWVVAKRNKNGKLRFSFHSLFLLWFY